MNLETTYHEDGTLTFWSVYEQRWISHAQNVPDRELAAMPADEREQTKMHLASGRITKNCPECDANNNRYGPGLIACRECGRIYEA